MWATRVGVLRAAWRWGEWLPLWWKEGNHGFGSPMPAFYHKLQNLVCALLLELVGNIEWAEVLSLLSFSMLGCIGLRRLALQLGASPWTATAHAALLPFTSYASAGWLIRGAFAEHAAFMLLPWLLLGLLELIEHGRVHLGLLAGSMIALFYAHSMTALFSVGLVGIALPIALVKHPRQRWHLLSKGALAAGCFALAIAPMAWVLHRLAPAFYLDHTIRGVYVVQRHLTGLANALFLGQAPPHLSFRLAPDPELWIALAGAALLALPRRWRSQTARPWADPALGFLIASFLLMTFLRLEAAAPIYGYVPGLRYIQFPWRLLSFLTLLLIAISAALCGRIRHQLATPLACAVLALLAARSRVLHHEDEEARIPYREMVAALEPSHDVRWWEYVPMVGKRPVRDDQLLNWAQAPASVTDACSVAFGGSRRHFLAECSGPGVIALPYSFSGLELVTDGTGRNVAVFRTKLDPRVRVSVGTGRTELRYRKPSWGSVARRAWLSLQH